MPIRDRNAVPVRVVVRRDQDRKLDRLTRDGKNRSEIVRDALDRLFSIVPDAEITGPGGHPIK